MLVVVIDADPAPNDALHSLPVVEGQAAVWTNAAVTASGLEWSANVEIDGTSRTMFFNHVTSLE